MYLVDALFECDATDQNSSNKPKPKKAGQPTQAVVVPFVLGLLDGISSIRVYIPKDLRYNIATTFG